MKCVTRARFWPGVAGPRVSRWLDAVNARHPWSHNDYFHSWILANLPAERTSALDVGCGRGRLVATLSPHFDRVLGTDIDGPMRAAARHRCAGLGNVRVSGEQLAELDGPFDLITMVAVLHHLDVREALAGVRRLLAPGGRFLAVGLARPSSAADHLWDLWSAVTNPVIGFVHHPWPSPDGHPPAPFPVQDPALSHDEIRRLLAEAMPGAAMRRRIGFRHTIGWTKPAAC